MRNLTPYEATCMPAMSLADDELMTLVVAGSFEMPPPGSPAPERLELSRAQLQVPLADVYNGAPGASSLKWECTASAELQRT